MNQITDLVLELTLILGLGVVVYLIAVAAPRVQDDRYFVDHPVKGWVRRLPLEHIDNFISGITDKTLRRVKIWILKADNFVSKHLNSHKDDKKSF